MIRLKGLILFGTALGGVCEELEIPMETVKIPGMGYVCKVRECEKPEYAEDGKRTCVTCDQSKGRDLTNAGTEFCPLELGRCEKGRCVPRTDTNFFETNFGKKWTGLDTFNAVTITHYGGSTASGGYNGAYDVDAIEKCMEKTGIDGVAAVPPMMYGSDAFYGQAMYKRNNLCYKIVGADGLSRVVAIMDRCGGYVQCSPGQNPIEDVTVSREFPRIDLAPGATVTADANQCVTNPNSQIHTGAGQRCWYFTDGSSFTPKACCEGRCSVQPNGKFGQVDWCGSNSHPHFDLSTKLMDLICDAGGGGGINAGSCQIQWVEPVKCPVWPKPGRCCEQNQTCGSCTPKAGSCGQNENECRTCAGKWCPGDKWHDLCDAHPSDIPSPRPDWTPNPPDPPTPTGPRPGRDPTPPPPDHADTPTTWPSGQTKPPVGPTNSPSGPTNTPHINTTTPTGSESKNNAPKIAGAMIGGVAALAAAAFGISKLQKPPQLEGDFEQGEEEHMAEEEDREGIVQQGSQDFY